MTTKQVVLYQQCFLLQKKDKVVETVYPLPQEPARVRNSNQEPVHQGNFANMEYERPTVEQELVTPKSQFDEVKLDKHSFLQEKVVLLRELATVEMKIRELSSEIEKLESFKNEDVTSAQLKRVNSSFQTKEENESVERDLEFTMASLGQLNHRIQIMEKEHPRQASNSDVTLELFNIHAVEESSKRAQGKPNIVSDSDVTLEKFNLITNEEASNTTQGKAKKMFQIQ